MDRDASWSYVHRKDIVTESANQMLLAFERERRSKMAAAKGKGTSNRKRPASAPPKPPASKRGGDENRGGSSSRGRGQGRGRGHRRLPVDSSDDELFFEPVPVDEDALHPDPE